MACQRGRDSSHWPELSCKNRGVMEIAEREAMARAIVDTNSYMTLSTADDDGLPWASPVWYATESYQEFSEFRKSQGARHSQSMVVRPEVGIVIESEHGLPRADDLFHHVDRSPMN